MVLAVLDERLEHRWTKDDSVAAKLRPVPVRAEKGGRRGNICEALGPAVDGEHRAGHSTQINR
jgi:hypothetical protein